MYKGERQNEKETGVKWGKISKEWEGERLSLGMKEWYVV